jgi:hypothetical protein
MRNIKLLIKDVLFKDDYNPLTDPKKVISLEFEEELDDIIPSIEIELKRDSEDLLTLSQGQIVEVFTGTTGTDRIFYGPIMDIKKDNRTIKIQANMETIELLRKKVNQLYRYFGESV